MSTQAQREERKRASAYVPRHVRQARASALRSGYAAGFEDGRRSAELDAASALLDEAASRAADAYAQGRADALADALERARSVVDRPELLDVLKLMLSSKGH